MPHFCPLLAEVGILILKLLLILPPPSYGRGAVVDPIPSKKGDLCRSMWDGEDIVSERCGLRSKSHDFGSIVPALAKIARACPERSRRDGALAVGGVRTQRSRLKGWATTESLEMGAPFLPAFGRSGDFDFKVAFDFASRRPGELGGLAPEGHCAAPRNRAPQSQTGTLTKINRRQRANSVSPESPYPHETHSPDLSARHILRDRDNVPATPILRR